MEIETNFKDLINVIKTNKIYEDYTHILGQLEENIDINKYVEEIKKLQKELVHEEHYKGPNIEKLEKLLQVKR